MHADVAIVPAELADLPGIRAIYNDAVLHSTATFDVHPRTEAEQRAWFEAHNGRHPVLAARAGREVVGWGSLNVFVPRPAYDRTVEDSVYVAAGRRGQGVGRRLLGALVAAAGKLGHHTVVARVADRSSASLALHRSLGFEEVGTLREAGWKFGRWIDVTLMQRVLGRPLPGQMNR
jgi:phosphinothricin acetyltransferase